MAQRRMFSKTISNSARFLKMPQEAQNLYFHLCLNADDDGIVEAFTTMQMLGSSEDTIRILTVRNFVKPLNEDLVTYILDWSEHNLIRPDRKVNSIYKDLLLKILPEVDFKDPKPRADTGVIPRQNFTGRPVDRIGKVRLVKDRVIKNTHGEFKNVFLTEEEHKKLLEKFGPEQTLALIEQLAGYIASKGKKYQSHYATILNWSRPRIDKPKRHIA